MTRRGDGGGAMSAVTTRGWAGSTVLKKQEIARAEKKLY
jgi:hypothetical protein